MDTFQTQDPRWPFLGSTLGKVLVALFVALTVFVGVKAVQQLVSFTTPSDQPPTNVITVSGKGEKLATPDVAIVDFSVFQESKTVTEAQKVVTDKTNKAIDFLKNNGVEEKDIKTVGYNIYPQYDYLQGGVCTQFGGCPSGRQVIRGYEVRQSVEVKIRDTAKAGSILTGLTNAGVNTVSNLQFVIDNQDTVTEEARKLAIEDAKKKADTLADQLGVRLVRIVSFNENGGYPMPLYSSVKAYGMGGADSAAVPPSTPTGENKITSNVMITYEIR